MTRDANDIAREAARHPERYGLANQPQNHAPKAPPKRGRVIGVYTFREGDLRHGDEAGEDLLAKDATVEFLGPDVLKVEDNEGRTYVVNVRAYRFIEFWAREDEGE